MLPEETREHILDKAEQRFWTFGFKKTTIDEIAADVRVGKGSIYQFFKSKEAIVLATIARHKRALLQEQVSIRQDPSLAPAEKLRRFVKLPILDTHRRFEEHPHGRDMVISFHSSLPDLLQPLVKEEVTLLAEILEEGRSQKQFTFDDALQTAWDIRNMTYGFWPPYGCVQGTKAVNAALDHLLDLVLGGLQTRLL
jgi:AcrR family transcriptional regulator